jgi:hypothetical protein
MSFNSAEVYEKLTADFPQDAFVVDKSRGFQLIGMRSAFIVERLTEVFGMLGFGWRYARSPFTQANKEIITEVILQYHVGDGATWPYIWDDGWKQDKNDKAIWSEPIIGVGGNQLGSGGVPLSDAQKSAESNALSKAASRIGVGIKAYKGLLTVEGQKVGIKGEDSQEKQLSQATTALVMALNWIISKDPGVYDDLRQKNKAVADYHERSIVAKVAKNIQKAELTKFVDDNLAKIAGRDTALAGLTTNELLFVNAMVDSIASKTITWKDALKLAKDWDHESDWITLLGTLKGAKENEGTGKEG